MRTFSRIGRDVFLVGYILFHRFSLYPFCVLQVRQMTQREFSRQTPECNGAKLLITSIAMRACRNRHFGTLMRCREAWKPTQHCFDTLSFECVDFQRLSQIFAILTLENIETHETEVWNLSLDEKRKILFWLDVGMANVPGAIINLCWHSVLWQMKRAILWRLNMNPVEDFVDWYDINWTDCFVESKTVFVHKTWYWWLWKDYSITWCSLSLQTHYICSLLRLSLVHRDVHPSQRCISFGQMTDNIFETETTALAHVARDPQESGVLLIDFAAAYPSVNHSWIFSVAENAGLPDFCRFPRSIHRASITHVEFAGAERGQFLMAWGVRQCCPSSGFLFAMAFDPIFRWFQESVNPMNPDNLDFLQLAQCAYVDLAAASFSFRGLLTAMAPGLRSIDRIRGLNLNYHKCPWVQYGNVEHGS